MHEFWWIILLIIGVFQLNFSLVLSLNDEGIALLKFREKIVNDPFEALSNWNDKIGETCPCSWFGIQCADGHVVSLNLENLCLEGTLSPELQHLIHIKSIILQNNSFYGTIPKEFRGLKELKLLNLGYNNLRRPLSHEFLQNIPALLLDSNGHACQLGKLAILQNTRLDGEKKEAKHSRMLEDARTPPKSDIGSGPPPVAISGGTSNSSELSPPSPPEKESPRGDTPSPPSPPSKEPSPALDDVLPPTSSSRTSSDSSSDGSSSSKTVPIAVGVVAGFVALALLGLAFWFWRGRKVNKQTGTASGGLTGQLQRAFVSGYDRSEDLLIEKPSFLEGVQNLRRVELETACEDFSNVIGTCSIGTIYKGTLSNGVEIAVISLAALSVKDWSKTLETQFRKKIETLSKVAHKNFISLIGYCEEEQPFTRMMVFEYAPNGSLFEHLHVREAEHLDWGMRLRVAMGMSYCLEYMHQLTPPLTHPNLISASVLLSDDYAAKLSDFCLWNEVAALQVQPIDLANLSSSSATPESNVYSYGLVMLEIMTGRMPHTFEGNESVDDWISEYLNDEKTLKELIDPMLRRYKSEQLEKVSELIKNCLHSEPQFRPAMKDVTARMKEITNIDQAKASPRLSPLWWAELESRASSTSPGLSTNSSS